MRTDSTTRALGWAVVLLAAGTLALGAAGVNSVTATPQHEVQIELEAGLPYNITEEAVAAAAEDRPLISWEPITFTVTTEHLTYDQLTRGADAGADVVLSFPQEEPEEDARARFDGVAFREGVLPLGADVSETRFDVQTAFEENLDLGHGPSAVVAAARSAGQQVYQGLPREPALWVGLVVGGAALTTVALLLWMTRRGRLDRLERRFRAGRLDLARVLLDQEALEVSFLAVPDDRRPKNFTVGWHRLRSEALQLARREDNLALRMRSTDPQIREGLDAQTTAFRRDARALAVQAQALEQSSRVHAGLAGSDTVLDRIAEPLIVGSRSLLARLRVAPPGTVDAAAAEALQQAHDGLLQLIQTWGPAAERAESGGKETARLRQDWTAAEKRLGQAAEEVGRQLRRFPAHGSTEVSQDHDDAELATLRGHLGLPEQPSGRALPKITRANGAARALLGNLDEADELASSANSGQRSLGAADLLGRLQRGLADISHTVDDSGRRRKSTGWFRVDEETGERTLTQRSWWVAAAIAAALTFIPAILIDESLQRTETWELVGEVPVEQVTVDGPDLGVLVQEEILRFVDGAFVEPVDVTVAVRDGDSYLHRGAQRTTYSVEVDRDATLDTLWRLKAEFPEKVDPVTQELLPGTVIVPVLVWGHDEVGVLYPMTGAVAEGERNRLGPFSFEREQVRVGDTDLLDVQIANALEDVGRGLQTTGLNRPEVSSGILTVVMWIALTAGLLALVAVVERIGGLSAGATRLMAAATRFSKGSTALRRVSKELEQLMLGLDDSRLSAVAVLGAGPAGSAQEAEQRLYERSLVAAWREVEGIQSLTVAERARPEAHQRIERLQTTVAQIRTRQTDVQARAEEQLRAARQADHPLES